MRACGRLTAPFTWPRRSAAGLDLCMHLVRRDYGAAVANQVARRPCNTGDRFAETSDATKSSSDRQPEAARGERVHQLLTFALRQLHQRGPQPAPALVTGEVRQRRLERGGQRAAFEHRANPANFHLAPSALPPYPLP